MRTKPTIWAKCNNILRMLTCCFRILYLSFTSLLNLLANLTIVNITASSNRLRRPVYLRCEVQGSPVTEVWWTKRGSVMRDYDDIRSQYKKRTLVFDYTRITDIGTYYCHARNNFSYVNASFALNLIGEF